MAIRRRRRLCRDKERQDSTRAKRSEREHRRPQGEKRKATIKKITLSAPCRKQQSKKKKSQGQVTLANLRFIVFSMIFLRILEKRQKKWRERRDSNPQHPP